MNSGLIIWDKDCQINERRIIESLKHLIESEMYNEAINEICNFEYIYGIIIINEIYNLIDNIILLLKLVKNLRLLHYKIWLTDNISTILSYRIRIK